MKFPGLLTTYPFNAAPFSLLKRSPAATVRESLLAAEYLLAGGNGQAVLCERGIRSYDPELRNTLDPAGMALARQLSHLPVIADPSHATGRPIWFRRCAVQPWRQAPMGLSSRYIRTLQTLFGWNAIFRFPPPSHA